MSRTARTLTLGSLAAAACLVTRWPQPWMLAGTDAALAVIALGCAAAARGARQWPGAVALAATAGLLASPTSLHPWVPLPDAVAGLLALAFCASILADPSAAAPWLGGRAPGKVRAVVRMMPWVLLAAVVVSAPRLVAASLPSRIGASAEVAGVGGPLLAGALLAAAVAGLGLVARALRRRDARPAPSSPSSRVAAGDLTDSLLPALEAEP